MIWRLPLFIAGLLICAVKGLLLVRLPLIPGEQEKEDMWRHCFGLTDPRMQPHWDRVGPLRSLLHDLTNVVVEWNRLHPQRGAKALCALAMVAALI